MKLPRHAFQTYWDAHAWCGALAAIVLHTMFFAGAFALFHHEIAAWQDVRTHHRSQCDAASLDPPVTRAIATSPFPARAVRVALPEEGCGPLSIDLRGADPRERVVRVGDPQTGALLDERSDVASFLFHLHFLYHPDLLDGSTIYVAGFLGVILLLAIVTGLAIHLKDLTRQLHRFRDQRGTRVLFSDLHKVLGVMGLPFQTMVALTGAIICFAAPLGRVWQGPVFDGDPAAALRTFFDIERAPPPTGQPGNALPIDVLIARAQAAVPTMQAHALRMDHVGDAAASVEVSGPVRGVPFGVARVRVRAADGEVLRVSVLDRAQATHVLVRWVYGLHYAWGLGTPTKLVYALLALAGCATLLSGNWIWLARRDRERRRRGNWVLARLTTGGGLGLATAVAAMFLANRAVPIDVPWHLEAELVAFGVAWGMALVAAFVMRDEARCAIALLAIAGATLIVVPALSVWVSPRSVLTAPWSGPVAVDLGLLGLGIVLLGCAVVVRRYARAAQA